LQECLSLVWWETVDVIEFSLEFDGCEFGLESFLFSICGVFLLSSSLLGSNLVSGRLGSSSCLILDLLGVCSLGRCLGSNLIGLLPLDSFFLSGES
jgi:hypothetical protein